MVKTNKARRKLSDDQVSELCSLYRSGKYTYQELSKRYGIGIRTVHNIIAGLTYKDVTGGETVPINRSSRSGQAGEMHPRHKLSEEQVLEIRELYRDGIMSQSEIAKKYGVSQCRVSLIVNRKSWYCLEDKEKDE